MLPFDDVKTILPSLRSRVAIYSTVSIAPTVACLSGDVLSLLMPSLDSGGIVITRVAATVFVVTVGAAFTWWFHKSEVSFWEGK